MKKTKVGILGATGAVGQRFVQLLENHPWFEVTELAASERSAGKSYTEAVAGRWKISADIPEYARDMQVKACKPGLDCDLVFGALDSSVAGPIESEFAKEGYFVVSNSRNHRFDDDVPLMSAEVNPEHLKLLARQKTKGKIVTNSNCTIMGVTLTLKALMDAFGLEEAMLFSMQAVSGAGYPGVPSLDILGNIVPFISGEEEKTEIEPLKILGTLTDGGIENAKFKISAHCNRVPVYNGHTVCVSVKLGKKAGIEEFKKALADFKGEPQRLKLPSAPEHPILLREEPDRPQARLDLMAGNGMATTVGRIRKDPLMDFKFVTLSHNTVRGAAGAAILNAELMKAKKLI
ncbi:MAG: aspartate-semialdehyde dehydrogenase [archaeon]|jgi:aspartate-semialdehyde dehydrogenase|nr:aspartate-semialdehyde dehydrogenase [archaeon]